MYPGLLTVPLFSCILIRLHSPIIIALFFADKLNHTWLKYVDMKLVNLGSGKRSLVKNGTLTAKYDLVLPRELF